MDEDNGHYTDNSLRFIAEVIPPDDIIEFADGLLQMCMVLGIALDKFSNLETVFEAYPQVRTVMTNIMQFQLRMKNNDTRIIDLSKFNLPD